MAPGSIPGDRISFEPSNILRQREAKRCTKASFKSGQNPQHSSMEKCSDLHKDNECQLFAFLIQVMLAFRAKQISRLLDSDQAAHTFARNDRRQTSFG